MLSLYSLAASLPDSIDIAVTLTTSEHGNVPKIRPYKPIGRPAHDRKEVELWSADARAVTGL